MKQLLLILLVPVVLVFAVGAITKAHIPLNLTTWSIGAILTALFVLKK